METIDFVLKFVTDLGKAMLSCGANVERVTLTIEMICRAYRLHDVSIRISNVHITVCARNKMGRIETIQVTVPPASFNLEKLKKLTDLAFFVRKKKPNPRHLDRHLERLATVDPYTLPVVYGGYIVAMASLCRIFGGVWQDMLIVLLNTTILFGLSLLWSRARLNRIITNVVNMFVCCSIAFGFHYLGFVQHFPVVIITNAFYMIPGIQMVNAMRNILCGNEMNGIIEMIKVVLEVVTIMAGLWLSFFCFGIWLEDGFSESILQIGQSLGNFELIFLSMLASLGFAVVFRIKPADLPYAAIGGTITRIALILMTSFFTIRVAYMAFAAFFAALFAELLALFKRTPATIWLYPSVVPLIPGDLFYFAMAGVVVQDELLFKTNGMEWVLALIGICVGFVVCSTFVHYIRKIRFRKAKREHKLQEQANS